MIAATYAGTEMDKEEQRGADDATQIMRQEEKKFLCEYKEGRERKGG